MAAADVDEGSNRHVPGDATLIHKALAIILAGFVVYVSLTRAFNIYQRLGTFLLVSIVYIYVRFPLETLPGEWTKPHYAKIIDAVLIVSVLASLGYLIVFSEQVIAAAGTVDDIEIVLGWIAILNVLESTRRTIGWTIPIFASVFLVYAYVGHYLPHVISHPGYSTNQVILQMYVSSNGLFSFPLRVMFDFVYLFVLFGALLEVSGGGRFFLDTAKVLMGKVQGGPAKLCVFASGAMGMTSGSAVANALTTGAFTIPTMKERGYSKEFAAGLESTASTGGQLIPPVMGAAVFIMMELTRIDYLTIMTHALVPGLLFFFCVFMAVHFQSIKENKSGLPADQIPTKRSVLVRLYYVIPIAVLVYLLVEGYSIRRTIVIATGVLIAITSLGSNSRLYNPREPSQTPISNPLLKGIELTAKRGAPITVAATCIGIVLGVIGLTGIGIKLSAMIMSIGAIHLVMALLVTMVLAIAFGMATDTVTVYILVAILIAPGLVDAGVDMLPAHLFIFYFGLMAMVTPPVCICAYAASTIAESDPIRSGIWAWKLSLPAYLLPFAFVFNDSLLLMGSATGIAVSIVTAVIGFTALAAASVGHMVIALRHWERLTLGAAAIVLSVFNSWLVVVGIGLLFVGIYSQVREQYARYTTRHVEGA